MRFRVRMVACLLAAAAPGAVGACTASPSQAPQPASPAANLWITGDSLAYGLGIEMRAPRPYVAAHPSTGFTDLAPRSLLTQTTEQLDAYGNPATLLVMAGVNDVEPVQAPSNIIAGMEAFDAAMAARGIRVVWLAEPAWVFAEGMVPVNDWILSRPDAIDCRWGAGTVTLDGYHPLGYSNLARCVEGALQSIPGLVID